MPTLEEYLSTDYVENLQQIADLDADIAAAARTLVASETQVGWSYEHRFGEAPREGRRSVGTMAMVLSSIGRSLGKSVFGLEGVTVRLPKALHGQLLTTYQSKFETLVRDVVSDTKLTSSTFGDNNPITLSHIADLIASTRPNFQSVEIAELLAAVKPAVDSVTELLNAANAGQANTSFLAPEKGVYQPGAFVPLRALRAATALKIEGPRQRLRSMFETILHEQLSFSVIPDSRFDPAELVFALEGMLRCGEHTVDAAIMHRVIEVLAHKQNTSSHWRPSKPFLAAETGEIILPVSVEVAISLLKSVEIMDAGRRRSVYAPQALPLLRRFWAWIQARSVRGRNQHSETCLGWHSEHVNAPEVVHTWDTSLVIEFMTGYRSMLERQMREVTLHLSGLSMKLSEPLESDAAKAWVDATRKFETSPASEAQGHHDHVPLVYDRIKAQFLDGWLAQEPANYSMLLYGPPGTGKTSAAKELARALGMPLITVTVSDFLGTGGANVEARAKAIFETLSHQRNVVILFDEIDSFLLDRDSPFYREQDSVFQFLTPGMLPKLQDLRDAERAIFVIATNYANRIDPAIKRTGRIDQSYLVSLPNATKRAAILKQEELEEALIDDATLRESVYLGYGDLAKVVQEFKLFRTDAPLEERRPVLIEKLKSAQRAASLQTYISRVFREPADFASAEFDDMIRLAVEVDAVDVLADAARTVHERGKGKKALRQMSEWARNEIAKAACAAGIKSIHMPAADTAVDAPSQ